MISLVDYYGKEVTDTRALVKHFGSDFDAAIRIDTHGGRYLEGLGEWTSSDLIPTNVIRTTSVIGKARDYLIGKGVSAAAAYKMRQVLDEAGAKNWKLIVSSGFNLHKVKTFAKVKAPIDLIGTGSFLPANWHDTYATADIIKYDDRFCVKTGREWLIEKSVELLKQLEE